MSGDHHPPETFPDHLVADDIAALDALVDSGFRLPSDLGQASRLPPSPSTSSSPRLIRLTQLLALLDTPPAAISDDQLAALVNVTMARIQRVVPEADAALTPDDQEALDAYVTAGYRVERVAGSLRPRAERLESMARLVALSPTDNPSADLVARTLAAIPARQRRTERPAFGVFSRFRIADLVSVAATLLIMVSIAWPAMAAVRGGQRQAACGANFGALASAMGVYANDFRGALPVATAGLGGPTWWDVGQGGRSNSANLYTLPKLQYTRLESVSCPTNSNAPRGHCKPDADDWTCVDEVSYSYQVMAGRHRPRWDGGKPVVVLADASPIVRRARRGESWHPMQNSENHAGRGQWVLMNDGSAGFVTRPEVGGDNIWLPAVYEVLIRKLGERIQAGDTSGSITIRGDELPASDRDTFLGP